jgi:multidrug efflux pump subunit AcrA (membrane-fusion protein)
LSPGKKVLIRADAFPEDVFHGKVKSITPQGDSVARSYRVRIELDTSTPLLIGMTAETNIILRESPNALLVPSLAVRENKVQVVTGDTVHVQDVTIGSRGPEKTEIVSGLNETDHLLKTYNTSLREGQKNSSSARRKVRRVYETSYHHRPSSPSRPQAAKYRFAFGDHSWRGLFSGHLRPDAGIGK